MQGNVRLGWRRRSNRLWGRLHDDGLSYWLGCWLCLLRLGMMIRRDRLEECFNIGRQGLRLSNFRNLLFHCVLSSIVGSSLRTALCRRARRAALDATAINRPRASGRLGQMKTARRVVRRPAEGWPKGWYYSGEVDTVNLDALLAPDEYFNRVILGRAKPRPEGTEARQPDLAAALPPESKA